MATTISTQDLIDVKRDIDDIGKSVNEKVIVSPRYGEDFKSIPLIVEEVEAAATQGLININNDVASVEAARVVAESQMNAKVASVEQIFDDKLSEWDDEAQGTITEWEAAIALITQEDGVPALAVSDASGETQQEINDITTQNTPSISSLRLFNPRKDGQVVNVLSHRVNFNLGGGLFKWDSTNTQADNNFNIIAVSGITTGRFIRVQSSKAASIEQAGGLSGEDCSVAVQTLHDAGITVITGEVGAVYSLKDVVISHKLKFSGDYKISKPALTDNMFSLTMSRYDFVFDGVEIDGAYLGDLSVGNPEIVISDGAQRGLVVRFKDAKFSNISKAVIETGYKLQGLIQSVQVKDCTSNGQHRIRAFSEQSCLFSVHNAALLSIDGFFEVGTNEFESTGSEAADVISMSMPLCVSTNTQFVGKNIHLHDGGGIVQYSGCHNSTLTDSIIDNCAYGWRVQNSRNVKIKGGAITRTKIRGAILYQPYARLNTSTASLKEDNVSGLTVESVTLKDNNGDFVISGSMVYASDLVKDPKVKLVKLLNVISDGCTAEWMNVQDGDLISISGTIVTNCQGNRFIRFHQSALNGAGLVDIENSEFDAGGRNMSLMGDPNNTITVKQSQTKVIVRDNVKLKNFQNSVSPVLYFRYIGELRFEDSEFIGANPPAVPYQANNCDLVVFKNIKGLNYPATINNGNNVNINLTNNTSVISDHLKLTSDIASEYVMTGTTAPTQTQMPIGSIARLAIPVPGQAPYYIYTESGWKPAANIQA